MGFVVTFILLFLAISGMLKKKSWIEPGIFFCLYWGIICCMASFTLFDIDSVRIKTWFIILVGTVAFFIGSSFSIKTATRQHDKEKTGYLSKKMFWIISLVALFFSIKGLIETILLVREGYSLALIRDAKLGLMSLGGYIKAVSYISILIDTIGSALRIIVIAAGIEFFVLDAKKNRRCLLIVIALVMIEAFNDGGRWGMLYFVIELVVCFAFYKSHKKDAFVKKRKLKKLIRIFVVVAGVFVVYISYMRNVYLDELVNHLYIYLCGCIPLLDKHIMRIDSIGVLWYPHGHLYGIEQFIMPVLERVLSIGNSARYNDAMMYVMCAQDNYNIGGNNYMNAFVTAFYYLYADLRGLGVFLGMFFFGFISNTIFKKCTQGRSVVPYLILTQMIIKSIQNYPTTSQIYVIVLLLMYVFEKNMFKIKS